ncbi:MAG TPA: hypothetical protein VF555_02135 [Variovorax sp.]
MNILIRLLSATALLVSSLAAVSAPIQVVIDPSDQHTTTYVSIPESIPEAKFDELKEAMKSREGARLVAWREFAREPGKYVAANIRRNDYPEIDLGRGLKMLLERFEGVPFGVTWNNGIAVTANDYAHSARTFVEYSTDPTQSRREKDRRRDPVHPLNHLEPLLAN